MSWPRVATIHIGALVTTVFIGGIAVILIGLGEICSGGILAGHLPAIALQFQKMRNGK